MMDFSKDNKIQGAKHWVSEFNQLYRPLSKFNEDSEKVIYVSDFNQAKFLPILLKEWFAILASSGYLVLDYNVSEEIGIEKIEKQMWRLWKDKYEIVFHGKIKYQESIKLNERKLLKFISLVNNKKYPEKIKLNDRVRFVCRKEEKTSIKNDDINSWTFGIITNGMRNDWIELMIQSIRKQKIQNYEIIICGTYFDRNEKDIKYVVFNDRDNRAWITKKKNIIAENAKYENLCILHDRIVLEDGWFEGMKQYGNSFEILTCIQKEPTGARAGDWVTLDGPFCRMSGVFELNYEDWDEYAYAGGMLTIIKKRVWRDILWDETFYHGQAEDIDLALRTKERGYITRFNNLSSCIALAWRYGKLPSKYNRVEGLLPKDMLLRRIRRFIFKIYPVYKLYFYLFDILHKNK